jgi:hypothetical protein
MPYKNPRSHRAKTSHKKAVARHRKKYPGRQAEASKRWRKNNPEKAKLSNGYSRKRHLKSCFGLKFSYEVALKRQKKRCKICKKTTRGERYRHFHVDHVRGTKKVRGLLCAKCNMGLGLFSHNPKHLLAAAKYLVAHG